MPQTIAFTKGHGTGNDFVIVPDDDGAIDLSDAQVAALCDRRFGIGGDGILRVVRSGALPEGAATPDAEWFMDYRNADGSAAEMCGNGIRVYAKYLVETGRATIDDGPLRIGTRAGTKTLTRSELGFEVDLGLFAVAPDEAVVRARGLDVARPGQGIDVGNPHVVVALSSVAELDDLDLTVQPQLHPLPAATRAGVPTTALGPRNLRNISTPIRLHTLDLAASPHPADPVCGVRVDPATAPAHRMTTDGKWWFCSTACADRFTAPYTRGPVSLGCPGAG